MELKIRQFCHLTTEELYQIYRHRTAVFVVEQNCPYQEVDGIDPDAEHLWLEENGAFLAYLRIYPDPERHHVMRVGRVLSLRRRNGLASLLLEHAIERIRQSGEADRIYLEAQTYAAALYEKAGFVRVTEEFLEDGIPHIGMERIL